MARPLLAALHMKRLIVNNRVGCFQILIFHDIPRSQEPALDRLLSEIRRSHGLLTPGDAEKWLRGTPAPGPKASSVPCLITFDDGFDANADVATGLLARHDIKAIFFVCPGLIDLGEDEQRAKICTNIFDGGISLNQLPAGKKLMGWKQLKQLSDAGHKIGAHGMSHRRLSLLNGNELRDEIVTAGRVIEAQLQTAVDWYAYSFGDVSSISRDALAIITSEYQYCRSGVRGVVGSSSHPAGLLAQEIGLDAPPVYQSLTLEGGLDMAHGKARKRLNSLLKNMATLDD